MATYINLDNLARYDMKAKARAESLYADASAACWQKTEKAGAVTCVPAPETPLEPVVEFLFKETLPEGTKGPSNPSSIAGVSSVKVTRSGANLLLRKQAGSRSFAHIDLTCDGNGGYTANGTPSAFWTTRDTPGSFNWDIRELPNGRYTLHFKEGSATIRIGATVVNNGVTNYIGTNEGAPIVLTDATTRYVLYFYGSSDSYSNSVSHPYLLIEGSEHEFEIPQDDRYTIPFGSTFYGGTLDVASGRLTVTHRMVEPSSGTVDISDRPAILPLEYTDTYGRTITSADGTSLDCGTSGGQIVYRLANPYTVQIDPTPIDSLPALGRTSPRINTVYTDALNVQVGYAEHPAYTEELINNAFLALGGNI